MVLNQLTIIYVRVQNRATECQFMGAANIMTSKMLYGSTSLKNVQLFLSLCLR
jgi:hypothetical protein